MNETCEHKYVDRIHANWHYKCKLCEAKLGYLGGNLQHTVIYCNKLFHRTSYIKFFYNGAYFGEAITSLGDIKTNEL